jgi:hypothetical protein
MDLQKLNLKFFVEQPSPLPLVSFIDIFHGWIQTTDGIYHDVADYSHMQNGPGIVLVAREANVSIDETSGRRGLLYSQKAPLSGTHQQKLYEVFSRALEYCRRLLDEPRLKGKLGFRFDEAEITLNDRLAVPNVPESFALLRPDFAAVAGRLFDKAGFELRQNGDPRQRFSITICALAPVGLETLLFRLRPTAQCDYRAADRGTP